MPELAEVETIRLQLNDLIVGETLKNFEATHPRSTRRHQSAIEVSDAIVGQTVIGTSRHGKYLTIDFGIHSLNIHLRMSGRLLAFASDNYQAINSPKHTHVTFNTENHYFLFIDPRTFGEIWLDDMRHTKRGVDALSEPELLIDVFKACGSTRMVKTILLDQNILAGIGNIYADEICAQSRILPSRRFTELSTKQKIKLAITTNHVLTNAIKFRGSSLRDESFSDLFGELGQYQKFHQVHDRYNEPCYQCGRKIEKIKISSRSTYFCPKCQK